MNKVSDCYNLNICLSYYVLVRGKKQGKIQNVWMIWNADYVVIALPLNAVIMLS